MPSVDGRFEHDGTSPVKVATRSSIDAQAHAGVSIKSTTAPNVRPLQVPDAASAV